MPFAVTWMDLEINMGLPQWLSGRESTCQCRRCRFAPWVRKICWRRKWQPTPVFLPGKSRGQRNLAGYSTWDCEELDMTEQLNNSNREDHMRGPAPVDPGNSKRGQRWRDQETTA